MIQPSSSFAQDVEVRKNLPYKQKLKALLQTKLDFHGENSIYATHSWHAFPAKFPPQLPRLFIRELTRPGDVIFDPMMGSCTTLIEALLLGRRAWGCDIDPLALRLGAAKVRPINVQLANTTGKRILSRAQKTLERNPKVLEKELGRRFDDDTRKFVDYWFAKRTQLELMALLREIEGLDDSTLSGFFTLIFSAIIITKSGGVSLARDLAHTRPHKVEKKPNSALTEFFKRMQRNFQNYDFHAKSKARIFEADARNLPLGENCVDLIVTSPPYANNAIDYMRAHKFSLVWLGQRVDELSELRRSYIGADSMAGIQLLPLPKHSGGIVQKLAHVDRRKGLALHRYYSEMKQAISEMHRVLRPGCAAILVVASSRIKGIDVDAGTCLCEIGKGAEFDLVHMGVRKLDRDKRMMPARWHNNNGNGIESRMHEEFVIGFQKPER